MLDFIGLKHYPDGTTDSRKRPARVDFSISGSRYGCSALQLAELTLCLRYFRNRVLAGDGREPAKTTSTPDGLLSWNDLTGVPNPAVILHHGDCTGVDAEAHAMSRDLGFATHCYPPIRTKNRAYTEPNDVVRPPGEYLDRNINLVLASSVLLAAPRNINGGVDPGYGGTWHAIRSAYEYGVPVWILGHWDARTRFHNFIENADEVVRWQGGGVYDGDNEEHRPNDPFADHLEETAYVLGLRPEVSEIEALYRPPQKAEYITKEDVLSTRGVDIPDLDTVKVGPDGTLFLNLEEIE